MEDGRREAALDFDQLVQLYYGPLYRFALSLTRTEDDASDLLQETFVVWARKGHQLQQKAKVKAWLFTTLHRLFLEKQRRRTRFPQVELTEAAEPWISVEPELVNRLDGATLVEMLDQVDPNYQAPIALFYLEDYSYPEIAKILSLPLGTVKSRIARGLAQLKQILASHSPAGQQTPPPKP